MTKNIKIENEVYQDIDIISVESADTAGERYEFIDKGNLQELKNLTIQENGNIEITPDSGYTAIKKVNVATDVNQAVEETIINTTENGTNIIAPSEGYLGYNKVTINTNVPNQVEEKSVSITSNGTTVYEPTSPNIGIKKLTVSTNVPSSTPNLQTKTVSITQNGTTNITPDTGYDGLANVTANVNVQAVGKENLFNITTNGATIIATLPSDGGLSYKRCGILILADYTGLNNDMVEESSSLYIWIYGYTQINSTISASACTMSIDKMGYNKFFSVTDSTDHKLSISYDAGTFLWYELTSVTYTVKYVFESVRET